MNESRIAVGLDIGTTKIVSIVGKRNENDKLEIMGIGHTKSLGVHRGVVNNITQTIQSIKDAVQEAEVSSGFKITDVTVGIAGQHIRSLQHSDHIIRPNFEEVISEEDIQRLVKQVHTLYMLPGEEIIHVLPQEFKVDSQADVYHPIGMYGRRLEANFHVVIGQISSIKNIARCVKSAGLNLKGITLQPIASSNASLSIEEKEAGVALVDIGGGTTDIAIFKDGIIRHTCVIPFGGNVITEDIKSGCSIIEKQAELLKVKFGSAWPGANNSNESVVISGLRGREPKEISLKHLSEIIHARILEILEQVYVELEGYGCDEQKKKLIGGIVMTGGGSKLKHIRQLSEYVTGMDVRIGYSNEHFAHEQDDDLANPEYATAVGLLMKGLEDDCIFKEEEALESKPIAEAIETKNIPEKQSGFTNFFKKKENVEIKKEKTIKEKKASIFSNWTEKFIEMINETD